MTSLQLIRVYLAHNSVLLMILPDCALMSQDAPSSVLLILKGQVVSEHITKGMAGSAPSWEVLLS